jgi:hypothetical protein
MSYRMIKRDGTLSYGFHNPDGSWVELPAPDGEPRTWSAPVPEIRATATHLSPPEHVRQFLRNIASKGGQSRARRHSRSELAAWGRVRHKTKPTV